MLCCHEALLEILSSHVITKQHNKKSPSRHVVLAAILAMLLLSYLTKLGPFLNKRRENHQSKLIRHSVSLCTYSYLYFLKPTYLNKFVVPLLLIYYYLCIQLLEMVL